MVQPSPPIGRNRPGLWIAAGCALLLTGCGNWDGASTPKPPSFTLAASPGSLQIPAGGSGYAVVSVVRRDGFTGPVALSVPGLPAGVVASGEILGSASTGYLTVAVDGGVSPQTWASLALDGQGATASAATPLALTVAPPLPATTLSPNLVNAPGGQQSGGQVQNTSIFQEPVTHDMGANPSGSTDNWPGFYPDADPYIP
jgi:hypothetical protein